MRKIINNVITDGKFFLKLFAKIIIIILLVSSLLNVVIVDLKQSETVANFFSLFIIVIIVYCLLSYQIHKAKLEIEYEIIVQKKYITGEISKVKSTREQIEIEEN